VAGRVVESHLTLGLVVGGHNEGDDGELSKAGGHGQDLSSVSVLVNVISVTGVFHTSRISTDN